MLRYYAERLSTVELNTTFYRTPSAEAVDGWFHAVPEDFRFAVKAHRRITHDRRLQGAQQDLELFAGRIGGLGEKLGPVLFQLPPTAEYGPGVLDRFLPLLPPTWRVAFQFRHPSWLTEPVISAVEQAGGAICHADGEPEPGPLGRGAFLYFRLRREAYPEPELEAWALRIHGFLAEGREVFAYFKHESAAPGLAAQLQGMVQTSARRV